jgi:phage tail-like protein
VTIPEISGPFSIVGNPPLAFRFFVSFFIAGGIPNPLDGLFQKVSGIGATISTTAIEEGGQNYYTQQLPQKVQYSNLVLERGLFVGSPLGLEFNVAMSSFAFSASNVLVSLIDNTRAPIASWLFINAYPVKWSVSDLDATNNSVVIEHMELTYQRMQSIRL